MGKKRIQLNRSHKAILVALLLSLLMHQLFFSKFGSFFFFPKSVPERELHEVSLQEIPLDNKEEEKKREEEPKKEEKVVQKAPTLKPKAVAQQKKPVSPPLNSAPTAPAIAPVTSEEESKPGDNGALGTLENEIANSGPMPDTTVPPSPPKLNLTWKSFDAIYGDKAAADRESYAAYSLERRRSRGAFGNYSQRVMKAVNNHQSFIAPGRQEPLGTRKAIFHNYIESIHEASIHPKFADSFLASLPALSAADPLNNPELMMVAEFEIFESGSISEIRVVKTSGNMVFDAGAVDAIYRSSPFPTPPKEVLSWNRRVYIRWGFYRNNRKCGVFNVEPYILRAPGAKEEALPVDKFTIQGG